MRKTMILTMVAAALLLSATAVAEDFRKLAKDPECTVNESTATVGFGWSELRSAAPGGWTRPVGFEITGKDGTKFWFRYLRKGSWSIPIKSASVFLRQEADSLEVTPASADTVYVLWYAQ